MKDDRIIYIVDGPDGTGKTTLCNKLSELYGIPVIHLTYYKDKKEHEKQFQDALDMLRKSPSGFILDRYIFSEKVYSDVYRDSKYISIFDDCLNALTYVNARVIISVPKDKVKYMDFFKKLHEEREEMYSPEQMGAVYDGYENFFKKDWNFNIARYDLFDIIDKND